MAAEPRARALLFERGARSLNSRIARRIFLLFVGCALVPLVLFAFLSLENVKTQLEEQARASLHESAKAAGMTVVERLSSLESEMHLALGDRAFDPALGLRSIPPVLRERLHARFEWLALGAADGALVEATREGVVLPALSPGESAHLARSGGLLIERSGEGRFADLLLAVAIPGSQPATHLVGEVRRSFLWGGEGFVPPDRVLLGFTESGALLFASTERPAAERAVADALRGAVASGQVEVAEESGDAFLASYRTMFTRPQLLRNFSLAHVQAKSLVLQPVAAFQTIFLLFTALAVFAVVLASLIQIRRSMIPLDVLTGATRRMREGDLAVRIAIDTNDEFRDLGISFNGMAEGLERYVAKMRALHRIGVALTAEKSSDRLLRIVTAGTHEVAGADLVILHVADGAGALRVARVSARSEEHDASALGHDERGPGASRSRKEVRSAAEEAAAVQRTVSLDDVFASEDFDAGFYRRVEKALRLRIGAVFCAPMLDHEGEVIGVLELARAAPAHGPARGFTAEESQLAESLASQAAVALTKNALVDDFRVLFESMTEVIATAIDEKSPYTGDHCRRVPVLTMMIAAEACAAKEGPFRDFTLTEDQLYELKIAALLHDCGKVTTPVHVVDKATKLETIHDRIDLVDTRFEVVKRDLVIAQLRRALERVGRSPEVAETATAELADDLAVLEAEREFLRSWNIGGEFMPAEAKARVREISNGRRWADPGGAFVPLLTDDEIENLCISRGTLTSAEREIINQHVVASIKMLERLPYPKHLANVPEIAGAHHERMDGAGYPKGLRREQIAVQGRMLGIADVFEALTAKDRPYKPGKTLSETLRILGSMKQEGHIDPDLFQLFVDSGVYLRYAREFLDEDQIDEVDLASIPGYVPPPGRGAESRQET